MASQQTSVTQVLQLESIFCIVAGMVFFKHRFYHFILNLKIYSGYPLGQVQNILLDFWADSNRDSLHL